MEVNEYKKLVEKYKEGHSTLSEEKFLFDNAKYSEDGLEAWSSFVKKNKTEIPNDFNETLWQSFQNKKTKKRRLFARITTVAASILLLISLFISNLGQKELSYSEKEVLLNQAINMFTDTNQKEIQQSVFYENEIIIIYTIIE